MKIIEITKNWNDWAFKLYSTKVIVVYETDSISLLEIETIVDVT